MPRTPAGTAATSAFDKMRWILSASRASPSERLLLLRRFNSRMEAAGAKLGIPLTVPWPPHFIHGVRSEMRPSSRRKGLGRAETTDGSLWMNDARRTNLPTLPPQLYPGINMAFRTSFVYRYLREFDANQIRSPTNDLFDDSRGYVKAGRVRREIVQE